MQSHVEIVNDALVVIGSSQISALDEDSPEAIEVNSIYHKTRRELLREHKWGFATMLNSIAAQSTDPIFKWSKFYTYPTDCIRIFRINNDYKTDYQIMLNASGTKSIACNVDSPLYIEYIKNVEDPTLFSQSFVSAFTALLALKLSYSITSSKKLQEQLYAVYHGSNGVVGVLNKAKATDSQEMQQQTEMDSRITPWEQARH